MKKLLPVMLLSILVLVIIGAWRWWQSPRSGIMKQQMIEKYTPRVTISSMNVAAIKEDTIQLFATVNIHNTAPIDLHLKQFHYQVYVEDEKIADDFYATPVTIASSDSGVISLPINLWAKAMQQKVNSLQQKNQDSMLCRVSATVVAILPLTGEKIFPVNARKQIPLKQLKELSIQNMNLSLEKGNGNAGQ